MYQVTIYRLTPDTVEPMTAKFFRTLSEAELWVEEARLFGPKDREYDIKEDDYYCPACGMTYYNCLCGHNDL